MSRQLIDSIWGSGGVLESPEVSIPGKVATGWVDEVPPYQWTNWHFNRTDQALEETERRGIWIWNAATVYYQHGLAIGSDGEEYRRTAAGAGTDPVGDLTGTWILAGPAIRMIRTVLIADDVTWAPDARTKTMKVQVTGGGGGAGGVADEVVERASSGGGGGGTAIKLLQAPFSATYVVLVGTGGNGGAGIDGFDGLPSSFDTTVIGGAGSGGFGMGAIGGTLPRAEGGVATGGDTNSDGGDGSHVLAGTIDGTIQVTMLSMSGGTQWAPGIGSQVSGSNGVDATGKGYGVGGGGLWRLGSGVRTGGDGADGAVVIEEYF